MESNFEVVVIGAGCAGMTSAIYLKRANINVLMIERLVPGGQINRTSKVDNYPGFISIDGPTLASNIFMQTQELNIPYMGTEVIDITDYQTHKVIKTTSGEIICQSIIIATGRRPKQLGLENEKELAGRGISWCAICDGPLFKNKDVVVVGGGNSALEESLYLAEITNKTTIVHLRNELRGDKILQSKTFNHDKIEVIYGSTVTKINATDNHLSSVEVEDISTGKKRNINAEGLFIYIGFEPVIDMLTNLKIKTDDNYIIVDENMRTNINNIYACGDVIKKELYQIATAIGEGARAAFSAIQDLRPAK
jgi:thioredoxin reductase (NADPH)